MQVSVACMCTLQNQVPRLTTVPAHLTLISRLGVAPAITVVRLAASMLAQSLKAISASKRSIHEVSSSEAVTASINASLGSLVQPFKDCRFIVLKKIAGDGTPQASADQQIFHVGRIVLHVQLNNEHTAVVRQNRGAIDFRNSVC